MLENFSNMTDKNIYKVSLRCISQSGKAYLDLSKSDNIHNMGSYNVRTILVQRTMSKDYVREVITGMLIPVKIEGFIERVNIEYPYFMFKRKYISRLNDVRSSIYIIHMIRSKNDYFLLNDKILQFEECKSSSEELQDYIKKHDDVYRWRYELETIFKEGESLYEIILAENLITDAGKLAIDNDKTAHLVKKLKKDNWK